MQNTNTRIRGNQGISVARHDGGIRALKRVTVVAAELGERPVHPEVAFEQVRHLPALIAPVRALLPTRVRFADPASETHAAHDLQYAFGRYLLSELIRQAHVDLPVAAPVGGPRPDLPDHGLEIRARRMPRMRQMVKVRGSGQPRYPQQGVEPVSLP